MKKKIKIVVIGAGNIAHHLLQLFLLNNEIEIVQIFNRQQTIAAKKLAKKSNTHLVSDYAKFITNADIYFICVKDDAIFDVAKELAKLNLKGLVVHTSGSVDVSVLQQASKKIGVFYPLQSFSVNDSVDWKSVPVFLEATTPSSLLLLKLIAKKNSAIVKVFNSQQRLQFHLAAVFASNFTNALYAVAFSLIEKEFPENDTKLLTPLITQSFNKMLKLSPKQAQTGPAKRGDKITMNKHLKLLEGNTSLKKTYMQLSDLIIEQQR